MIDSHEFDFSEVATSPVTPLWINVSGGTVSSPYGPLANDTAVVASVTYSVGGIVSFVGSSFGNTVLLAGAVAATRSPAKAPTTSST